ncbi:hypothetical protein Nepgr_027757 [Nepenthes gracilis]|uniref:Uncharacterized protein n=1 Tax=Nepenthes gracilis TaxID=150966 RepID=A0AAD3TAX1_NEPGR|nr:hypothetical protein Nepgr_027757 [Nepenthes gracilis]
MVRSLSSTTSMASLGTASQSPPFGRVGSLSTSQKVAGSSPPRRLGTDNYRHAMDDVLPTTNAFAALQDGIKVCSSIGPSAKASISDSSPCE